MVNGNNRSLALGIVMSLLFLSMFASVGFVSADEVTVTFSGITNPSSTHVAYKFQGTSTDWGKSGTEITSADYCCTTTNNAIYATSGGVATGASGYSFHRFEFNISKIAIDDGFSENDITSIYLRWEGWGYRYNSGDIYGDDYLAVLNADAGTWQTSDITGVTGTWSDTSSGQTDDTLVVTISEANVSDFISDIGSILKFTARTGAPDGSNGTWLKSDLVYLKITYTPSLTTPVLVSPTNGGTGYSITPDFDWNVSTGGTSPYTYEIMVADNLGFTTPDVNVTGLSDSNYSYTTGLTPATTYYWKVRTLDAGSAYSSWATTQSFTTATFTSPTFTIPTSGTSMTTVTPTFSWTAPTGGSGTYTYELQVSLANTFATNVVDVTGIATTSYTMTSNLTPDVFYARIRSKDSLNNYSAWSSTITFTAVAPSSGGSSSSSSSSTQEPYVPPTLTTPDNDDDTTVAPSSGGSVTNIINQYIINPARTIVINPLKLLWDWFVGLFHGSSQETLIEPVADEAESEFNRIVKDMSEDWDAFWSDVEIFIEDIKEVLGC